MLARPAHSSYGSSSSAVSQASTGRPRSSRSSLTSPRSPTSPCSWRPSPSRQTTPADQGPSPRSRSSRRTTASVGTPWRRSKSRLRQSRTTAAPRRSCSPSRRNSNGAKAARSVLVGGYIRPVPGTASKRARLWNARVTRRSRFRPVFQSTSWPQAAEVFRGAAEQRVVRDPAQELRVVVVEREHPAELLRRLLGLRADPHRPVRRLPGPRDAAATAGRDDAFAHPPRRVSGEPSGERERVRTARGDVQLDHVPSLLARVDTPERASCGRLGPGLPSPDVSKSLTQRDLLLAVALVVVAVVAFSSLRSHHATSSILADPAR